MCFSLGWMMGLRGEGQEARKEAGSFLWLKVRGLDEASHIEMMSLGQV